MKRDINWQKIGEDLKTYVLNKYILTTLVFGIIMLFVGDRCILKRIQRARQIHALEQQLDAYRQGIDEANRDIQMLRNMDSLERYAREHYYMHTDNEDVYIIK